MVILHVQSYDSKWVIINKLVKLLNSNIFIPMRTTIILDDKLCDRLREAARRRKMSLSAFMAEAGRLALGESAAKPSVEPFDLVTYGGSGTYPNINLDKTGQLLAAEDESEYRT